MTFGLCMGGYPHTPAHTSVWWCGPNRAPDWHVPRLLSLNLSTAKQNCGSLGINVCIRHGARVQLCSSGGNGGIHCPSLDLQCHCCHGQRSCDICGISEPRASSMFLSLSQQKPFQIYTLMSQPIQDGASAPFVTVAPTVF